MAQCLFFLVAVMATSSFAATVVRNTLLDNKMGKDERAMFRAHSDECLKQSGADREKVEKLLEGFFTDDETMKKHVYCVLVQCKMVGKDGKIKKNAIMNKLATRPDAKNATKTFESCVSVAGKTPEDLAWNFFRCGLERKVFFEYMPLMTSSGENENL